MVAPFENQYLIYILLEKYDSSYIHPQSLLELSVKYYKLVFLSSILPKSRSLSSLDQVLEIPNLEL